MGLRDDDMEIQHEINLRKDMETYTCADCLHSALPGEDGFQGLDDRIAFCLERCEFVDPEKYAVDIDCEEIRV